MIPTTLAIKALASDLDGTLLPLVDDPHNRSDLSILSELLRRSGIPLIFVTGRPLWSVAETIKSGELPRPDGLIANVGTEIYLTQGGDYQEVVAYREQLDRIAPPETFARAGEQLRDDRRLELQEENKQGRHKLSYYCRSEETASLAKWLQGWIEAASLPLGIVASIDPFADQGLIDLLPAGVDKNYALRWWCQHRQWEAESVVYAGDSGNDTAAMQSGFLSILVSNADRSVREQLLGYHQETFGDHNRLFLAQRAATSGVLEGIRHFLAATHDATDRS